MFFDSKFYNLCVYFGYHLLVILMICKHFHPFSKLSFYFVDGFLCHAKFLRWIRSHLFIFAFVSFGLGDGYQKYNTIFMSKIVLSMFSSKSFIVSGITYRSLVHFEFIFVYDVRKCSKVILLHVTVHFSQHHLFKKLSFLYCIFLFLVID